MERPLPDRRKEKPPLPENLVAREMVGPLRILRAWSRLLLRGSQRISPRMDSDTQDVDRPGDDRADEITDVAGETFSGERQQRRHRRARKANEMKLKSLWAVALPRLVRALRARHYCWKTGGHVDRFVRNIYGDEINARNGMRSEWKCNCCGRYKLRPQLVYLSLESSSTNS